MSAFASGQAAAKQGQKRPRNVLQGARCRLLNPKTFIIRMQFAQTACSSRVLNMIPSLQKMS